MINHVAGIGEMNAMACDRDTKEVNVGGQGRFLGIHVT
jgi:hypothetical protein